MWQQHDTPIEGRVVCGVVARGPLKPFPQREEGKNGRWSRKFENTRRENGLRMVMCCFLTCLKEHAHLYVHVIISMRQQERRQLGIPNSSGVLSSVCQGLGVPWIHDIYEAPMSPSTCCPNDRYSFSAVTTTNTTVTSKSERPAIY